MLQAEKKAMQNEFEDIKSKLLSEHQVNCDSLKKEIQTEKDRADILASKISDLKNENKELGIKMKAIEENSLLAEQKSTAKMEKQTSDLKNEYEKKRKL